MANIRKSWAILGFSTASVLALALGCGVSGDDAGEASEAQLTTSSDLVISQVYGGGGGGGAKFKNDYIELFNRGKEPVSLKGKSLQYVSSGGAFDKTKAAALPEDVTIPPGHYYLIKTGEAGEDGAEVADANHTLLINLTNDKGKVAIVPSDALLDSCGVEGAPIGGDAGRTERCAEGSWIDFVGYGAASQAEDSPAPAPGKTTAVFRKGGGCVDTGNNAEDFEVAEAAPRHAGSPANPCREAGNDAGSDARPPSGGDAGADARADAASADSGGGGGGNTVRDSSTSARDSGTRRDAGRRDSGGEDEDEDNGEEFEDEPTDDEAPIERPPPKKPAKTAPLRKGSSDCSVSHGPVQGGGVFASVFGVALALVGARRRSRASR